MRVSISTNAPELSGMMRIFRDQLPFAVQTAVRSTALDFQEHQRKHQADVFTIRRKTFMNRAVKMRHWPTKENPMAEVAIDPPGGMARADIIARHEEGGSKPAGPGHRGKAVPREAQPFPQQMVPKRLRPKQLGLQRVASRGGVEVYQGRNRTFMLRNPDGSGAIFQRTGPGGWGTLEGTRLLWIISAGGVRIDPVLNFVENARAVVEERWEPNMAAAWDRALRTAR